MPVLFASANLVARKFASSQVYVEIQLLKKHGLSLRRIAVEVGCAVNTVRRHLALEAVPKYERKVKREFERGLFYQALDVVPEVLQGDDLELDDYAVNFRRMFGNPRMDTVLGQACNAYFKSDIWNSCQ